MEDGRSTSMDKTMEKKKDGVSTEETRYGGIKAMPFVIGKSDYKARFSSVYVYVFS